MKDNIIAFIVAPTMVICLLVLIILYPQILWFLFIGFFVLFIGRRMKSENRRI